MTRTVGTKLVSDDLYSNWPVREPPQPGTYGQNWRALFRPDINGLSIDGKVGPLSKDETGASYPARIDGSTYAALGTALAPAQITYDRVNGWTSTAGSMAAIPGTNLLTENGLPTLKNADVIGSILIDGISNQISGGDVVVSGTPSTLALTGNPTKSNGGVVGGGFPTGASTYFCYVGRILCLFDNATSAQLNNVRTVDGQSYQIFAGESVTQVDASGLNTVAARLRNVRIMAPVVVSLVRARSTLQTQFVISAAPKTATIATSAIAAGTSPATITVSSTTGFPASGKILVGDDFVTYTSTTSTTFAGCTWPGGGATDLWDIGFFVFNVDDYTLTLTDASTFPSAGTIELDASLEVHYQAKSGNNLTGCAVASRWSSSVRTYGAGLEVRTCIGDEKAETKDPSTLYGNLGAVGARIDTRDCVQSYSAKGPGAFRFFTSFGSKVDHHYTDLNWYDVCRIYGSTGQVNISNSVFITHPGTGNTGAPHVDGVQGWHCSQLDGTPVVSNSAFLGSLTNSHWFWNAGGAGNTSASESWFTVPQGIYCFNCLFASSQAGSTNGKGSLIDESYNCGAEKSWYDNNLFQTLNGPSPRTSTSADVAAGATSIPLASTVGFTAGSVSTTLVSNTTITRDLSFSAILASLTLTDASALTANRPCYILLDDGTKQCVVRADYRSANVLNVVRWINGTAGTYTSASTTVYLAVGNGWAQVIHDSVGRMGLIVFTGVAGGSLTGVKGLEYAIPNGAMVTPLDISHPPPVRMRNFYNRVWNPGSHHPGTIYESY
jgi:hypothetical protein